MQKMHEPLDGFSLDELLTFVAVVKAGSFVDAAKAVDRDATIVSRRVAQLESRLGIRLFSRTTRRLSLTEVGALYYQRVQAILEELHSASLDASNFAASPRGLLRVSLPIVFGQRWITPLLPTFLADHPQIQMEVNYTDRYVDIVAEGFDVAIRLGALRDSSLIASRIAPFRNLLYAAPSYVAARGAPRSPEELTTHQCLGFSNHMSWPDWVLTHARQRRTIRPTGPLVSDNAESLLQLAMAGEGIILTPDWLAGPAVRDHMLVQVLTGWQGSGERGIYAVTPPGRLMPIKARVFIDAITKAVRTGWTT